MRGIVRYKEELKYFLYITAFSPALGILALFKAKTDRFIVTGSVLMMGLFGAFFAYPKGSDGYTHYSHSLEFYTDMDFSEFWIESWYILIQSPNYSAKDLYLHALSFLSNSFLGLPKSMHFFAGLFLGYVIAKSLLLVLGSNLKKISWQSGLAVFIVLLMIHSVHSLNAIRIATGSWVLFYGATSYYFRKKFKYLLFIFLATQIHLAIAIMALPAIAGFFIAQRKWLIIAVWVISFFTQLSFGDVSAYLPKTDVVEYSVNGYVLEGHRMEEYRSTQSAFEGNWYAQYGPKLYFSWALPILLLGHLLTYFRNKDRYFNYLFGSSLLFYAFSNIVVFMPSLQGRLMNLTSLFLLFAVLLYQAKILSSGKFVRNSGIKRYSIIMFVVISIPYIFKNFSHILNTTEPFFVFLPFFVFFYNDNLSIREVLGDII